MFDTDPEKQIKAAKQSRKLLIAVSDTLHQKPVIISIPWQFFKSFKEADNTLKPDDRYKLALDLIDVNTSKLVNTTLLGFTGGALCFAILYKQLGKYAVKYAKNRNNSLWSKFFPIVFGATGFSLGGMAIGYNTGYKKASRKLYLEYASMPELQPFLLSILSRRDTFRWAIYFAETYKNPALLNEVHKTLDQNLELVERQLEKNGMMGNKKQEPLNIGDKNSENDNDNSSSIFDSLEPSKSDAKSTSTKEASPFLGLDPSNAWDRIHRRIRSFGPTDAFWVFAICRPHASQLTGPTGNLVQDIYTSYDSDYTLDLPTEKQVEEMTDDFLSDSAVQSLYSGDKNNK